MSYDFKKLSEVDILDEITDEATVLVEDGGDVKRTSMSNIKGSGCVAVDVDKIVFELADELGKSMAFSKTSPMRIISDDDYNAIVDAYNNSIPCLFKGTYFDMVTKIQTMSFSILPKNTTGSSVFGTNVIGAFFTASLTAGGNIIFTLHKASSLNETGWGSPEGIAEIKEYLVSKGYAKS